MAFAFKATLIKFCAVPWRRAAHKDSQCVWHTDLPKMHLFGQVALVALQPAFKRKRAAHRALSSRKIRQNRKCTHILAHACTANTKLIKCTTEKNNVNKSTMCKKTATGIEQDTRTQRKTRSTMPYGSQPQITHHHALTNTLCAQTSSKGKKCTRICPRCTHSGRWCWLHCNPPSKENARLIARFHLASFVKTKNAHTSWHMHAQQNSKLKCTTERNNMKHYTMCKKTATRIEKHTRPHKGKRFQQCHTANNIR